MKRKWKITLGCIGLVMFATLMTILIMKNNLRQVEAQYEEDEKAQAIEAPKEVFSEETLAFPDKRGFTEDELDNEEWPEGKDYYGDDEPEPMYHVTINDFEELYTRYNDWKICNELPYYLHTYFNLCTGNLDEYYVVTLTEGSCVCSDDTMLVTLEATVDKYPGMTIYIEYDKAEREFGISSLLGDYSLDALRKRGNESSFKIDYSEDDDTGLQNAMPSTEVEDAEDD